MTASYLEIASASRPCACRITPAANLLDTPAGAWLPLAVRVGSSNSRTNRAFSWPECSNVGEFQEFGHRRPYHGLGGRCKNPVAFARRDRNTAGALAQTKRSSEPLIYRREVGPANMIAVSDEIVRRKFPIVGMTHLCIPQMTSAPASRRSKQATSGCGCTSSALTVNAQW